MSLFFVIVNILKELTDDELVIRRKLATVRKYPRWKYIPYTKGFLFYVTPSSSEAEAFKHWDGHWSVGRHPMTTWRDFNTLLEALKYGEQLTGHRQFV